MLKPLRAVRHLAVLFAAATTTTTFEGLPAGSGLDYADELTLSRALEGRRDFQ